MCGIAGFIGHSELSPDRISQTLDLMKNRGPDHQAQKSFRFGDLYAHLLHSRLSIIDLDERSHQPFTQGDLTLVYNGEIYNYIELRNELKARGVSFSTESDTEVLLKSFMEYGPDCVKRFEGMWSFAIYDRKTGTLHLSRDRFGEKPLYYFRAPEGFYFGSEIKFLRTLSGQRFKLNERQLLRYLINGYKSLYKGGETFFEEVHEVPYATNARIDSHLHLSSSRYWQPRHSPQTMTLNEAIEGVRHHLGESLRIRLRADVPIAFCLSGGVDSSALVSLAAKQFGCDVSTFTIIDPDERYNEYPNVKATVDDLGCKNTQIALERSGDLKPLARLIDYHDAPIATITYYIHSFLSRAISQQKYRVVFSGTSADELFTGYYDHFNLHLYEMRDRSDFPEYLRDWKTHIEPIVRNPYLRQPDLYMKDPTERAHVFFRNDEFATYLKRDFHEPFAEETFCDSLLRNRMLNELFHEATPVILHEDDLNSMYYSIENRSPYLDSRLFEFAYSVPSEHLIRDGYGKFLLREAMKGVLNDQVRLDRTKRGFNASILSVFDLENEKVRDELLAPGPIFDFFKRDKMEKLLRSEQLPNSDSKFLFNFINAKLFLEQIQ